MLSPTTTAAGGSYEQVNQWDEQGKTIKRLADRSGDAKTFIEQALELMEVHHVRHCN
jgi:hypothetical protein